MTRIKERAIEMIQRIPDDDMLYVINILQNLEEMATSKNTDNEQAMAAFQDILKYRGRLPKDFEDCLQEECVVEEIADYIVTRNPDDFIESRVKVIQPDEFLHLL